MWSHGIVVPPPTLDEELGFAIGRQEETLDSMLEYCGYSGLSSIDLENLDSDVLMDPQRMAAECSSPERNGYARLTLQAGLLGPVPTG